MNLLKGARGVTTLKCNPYWRRSPECPPLTIQCTAMCPLRASLATENFTAVSKMELWLFVISSMARGLWLGRYAWKPVLNFIFVWLRSFNRNIWNWTYSEKAQGIVEVINVGYILSIDSTGYYADPRSACQSFHVCDRSGGHFSFLCPNGTIFNQEIFACDWWVASMCNDL